MDAKLTTISSIEAFFYDLLVNAGISQNVYVGDFPHNVKDSWNEAVIIDTAGYMRNLGSRCETSVLVMLYAKPFGDGSKNVPKLDEMENKLHEAISGCAHEHYFVRMGSQYADYDQARDLHCNIYTIELLIS